MGEAIFELPPEISQDEAKLFLAIKLYESGKFSIGQAAKYAGFTKRTFIELVSKHDVAVIDYPVEELKQEIDL